MAQETASVPMYVDDFYFSVLADDENKNQAFLVSDAKYAEELQFQEVMMGSLITSQMANNGASSSSSPMVQLSLPPAMLSNTSNPIPNPEPVEGTEEAGESSYCFCEICGDRKDRDQMFRNESCVHSFCSDCIGKHIASKIQDSITIVSCPGLDCKVVLEVDACRPVLPKDVLERWDEAICQALFPASQKLYCPFKDCSAMLLNDNGEGEVIRESECPYCHRLFCAQCHDAWHPGVECEEFQRMNEDERGRSDLMVRELAKERRWMRCPHCKYYVERAEGCLHMTCRIVVAGAPSSFAIDVEENGLNIVVVAREIRYGAEKLH
ncbi:hypothetical protein CJ030_MR5G010371 [Morella rubra]|uniref:RBR-type E3 ubiquitin transferase n=1 Tax=Morella rubra TaxID=262757 RepID=A0A6A1VNL5_9ROSI|nr:hypothetical protein CJ030_MR5G010371 [Morella rubra]